METGSQTVKITVTEDDAGTRIDSFLGNVAEVDISRSKAQKLIDENHITVNGQPVTKKYKVLSGDIIEIESFAPEPVLLAPEPINLEIVFEDDYLAVINKPAGLVTHPGAGNKSGTLVNALLYHLKTLAATDEPDRPGIVHRLDKNTSGLLLVAKEEGVYRKLQKAIQNREVKRTYLALVCGHMQSDSDIIDLPIGRSIKDRKKMAVTDQNSRAAQTEYSLIKRYRSYDLLDVTLLTGRTHQIRVHFSHIGHPVFGDPEYGGREKWHKGIFAPERPLGKKLLGLIKRQALHAKKLVFEHPVSGQEMTCEAQVPDDYNKILNVLDHEGY